MRLEFKTKKQNLIDNKKMEIKEKELEIDRLYLKYKQTDDKNFIFRIQDMLNHLEHLYIELRLLEN